MSRNFYVRGYVKFALANKIEAMSERSHVYVRFKPRTTSPLEKKLNTLYLASIFFYEIELYVRVRPPKDYATVEIYPMRNQNQNVIANRNALNRNVSKARKVSLSDCTSFAAK